MSLLVVRLDDARFGGGPGTVVGHAIDVTDYHRQTTDRDGAHDPHMRLWQGDFAIGSRVQLGLPAEGR